ncbi:preprotein translocase, SecY subunit [Sphaceloma murrayae]|uniref:Preprotein translocase, SecY subunit n=1 Tax=Sphaceloma murrayae TaxID=2082308 RepID=A0A2K1QXQ2_9PEZI|nr:preprotein translocase, SecY subunit [Sphaceloma murrayae]
MQAANRLQNALRKGGATFGGWQMLPGTNISRAIARTGFDWICVDTEHGNISDDNMHECVAAIAACGVSPIVRVAANEAWMVKRALDAGAHGIVVPLLKTAEDARQIVSAAKFPPQGTRGFGSPFSMEKFHTAEKGGLRQSEYYQQANDGLVTVIQIETKEALKNVDEIALVPGVDVLLIGPFDLGNNIGYPIIDSMHEELKKAINRIHESAKKAGKRTGIYCTSGEQARDYAERGFHMISVVTDAAALPQACDAALKAAQGAQNLNKRNMSYS